METKDKLAAIREACIAANPEIGELNAFECPTGEHEDTYIYRPIRLADVLFAIWKKDPANRTNITVESSGQFMWLTHDNDGTYKHSGPEWNLPHDSLDWHAEHQPETIDFLYDVLKQE